MSRRRDPVQRRDDGDVELHDVVEWEPRTVVDRAVFVVYSAATRGFRVVFVVFALALLGWQLAVEAGPLLTDPVVVGFVVLSALPALALVAFVWYADVTTAAPPGLLAVTFLLGLLVVAVAGLLNSVLGGFLGEFLDRYLLASVATALVFVLVVAPVEEVVKLLAVHLYAYRSPAFDSVITGAVFGAAAGLGFATMENAFYIAQVVTDGPTTAAANGGAITTVRALVGPGHVIYSAFAGYYLGLARFNRRYAGPVVFKGLAIAVSLHALYNVLVSTEALHAPGYLVDVFGFSSVAAVFTVVVAYNGVLTVLLLYKLSQYRAVYRATRDDDPIESELTEFERDVE
jgi:RsiW-degrading membrane proteinase PrsW (M82 family)